MNINEDSFDHRFGDDLFELIISYLPIEDKLRYESVSKRFQRLVFNKQEVLSIVPYWETTVNRDDFRLLVHSKNNEWRALEALLKKLPNIRKISYPSLHRDMTEVMNTITNHCHHLNAIHLNFKEVNSEALKRFCHKFEHQLQTISLSQSFSKVFNFESFPKLRSISHPSEEQLNTRYLPKKLLKMESLRVFDEKFLRLLSDNKFQYLRHLDISLKLYSTPKSGSFEEMSELKNLKSLKIHVLSAYGSDVWPKTIELIARKCLNLEYFDFTYDKSTDINTNMCFQSLTHFSGLKKLLFVVEFDSKPTEANQMTDLSALKNCRNLLSLTLKFSDINDGLIDGIHSFVPQLRQLTLKSPHPTDPMLESLTKLKSLTHLDISSTSLGGITVEAIKSLKGQLNHLKVLNIFGLDWINIPHSR